MARCSICQSRDDVEYAWQPWGPAENAPRRGCFPFLGWHYHGFPSVPVCERCRVAIEAGQPVEFYHKGIWYRLAGDTLEPR